MPPKRQKTQHNKTARTGTDPEPDRISFRDPVANEVEIESTKSDLRGLTDGTRPAGVPKNWPVKPDAKKLPDAYKLWVDTTALYLWHDARQQRKIAEAFRKGQVHREKTLDTAMGKHLLAEGLKTLIQEVGPAISDVTLIQESLKDDTDLRGLCKSMDARIQEMTRVLAGMSEGLEGEGVKEPSSAAVHTDNGAPPARKRKQRSGPSATGTRKTTASARKDANKTALAKIMGEEVAVSFLAMDQAHKFDTDPIIGVTKHYNLFVRGDQEVTPDLTTAAKNLSDDLFTPLQACASMIELLAQMKTDESESIMVSTVRVIFQRDERDGKTWHDVKTWFRDIINVVETLDAHKALELSRDKEVSPFGQWPCPSKRDGRKYADGLYKHTIALLYMVRLIMKKTAERLFVSQPLHALNLTGLALVDFEAPDIDDARKNFRDYTENIVKEILRIINGPCERLAKIVLLLCRFYPGKAFHLRAEGISDTFTGTVAELVTLYQNTMTDREKQVPLRNKLTDGMFATLAAMRRFYNAIPPEPVPTGTGRSDMEVDDDGMSVVSGIDDDEQNLDGLYDGTFGLGLEDGAAARVVHDLLQGCGSGSKRPSVGGKQLPTLVAPVSTDASNTDPDNSGSGSSSSSSEEEEYERPGTLMLFPRGATAVRDTRNLTGP